MKTNLFIAGACKSGTTFLHDYLSSQEDICGSIPKEPYFFELEKKYRNELSYFNSVFKNYNDEKYLLDGRHRTMFFSWIAYDVFIYNPEAKFIFILRDPIERAYSHWWMWYSRGVLKKSFHKTIINELKLINEGKSFFKMTPEDYKNYVENHSYDSRIAYADANSIIETGQYYSQIIQFQKYYKKENLLFLDFERLNDFGYLNQTLSDFLGVNIVNIKKESIKNKAKTFKKHNLKFKVFLPNKVKLILKNLFFKKPKLKMKSRIILTKHYKEMNKELFTQLGISFTKKWI